MVGILVADGKRRGEQGDGTGVMRRSQLEPTIRGLARMKKTFVQNLFKPTRIECTDESYT
jgi:hypothetical protein